MSEASCPRHSDYQRIIIDIATGDTMFDDPVQVDEVRRHVAACEFCRKELEACQSIVAALTPPPIPNEEELVAEIAANLRRTVLAKLAAWERRRRLLRWPAGAAAAAALIAVAVILWPARRAPDPSARPRASPVLEGETPALVPTKEVEPPHRPREGLTEAARKGMLEAIWLVLHNAERQLRRKHDDATLAAVRRAIEKARVLIAAAPGTREARRARFCLARCLEMTGERVEADAEFEAYLEAVAAAEGAEAACQILLVEGKRESQLRNYDVALRRFRTVLAYVREGETAARAYLGIGHCYAGAHHRHQANAAFRQALTLGLPTREAARGYRLLIGSAIVRRDYEQARRDTAALLALPTPPAERAMDEARLGLVLERTAGPMKAAQHYRQIISKYPEKHCRFAQARLRRLQARLDADILAPLPGEPGGANN